MSQEILYSRSWPNSASSSDQNSTYFAPPNDCLDDCLDYLVYGNETWIKSDYDNEGDWIGWSKE